MRKDLENFVKSASKDENILLITFLEFPEGEESLLIVGNSFNHPFEERESLFLRFLPNSSNIRVVCYSLLEWKWIVDHRESFAQFVKDFGEHIFRRRVLGKLLSSIQRERVSPPDDTIIKGWVEKVAKERIEVQLLGEAFYVLAERDFQAAKILFTNHFFNQSVILLSQSVEKYIKGYLAKKMGILDKSHNLTKLCERANILHALSPHEQKKIADLQKLYLLLRYPAYSFSSRLGKPIEASERKSREYLSLVEKVRSVI